MAKRSVSRFFLALVCVYLSMALLCGAALTDEPTATQTDTETPAAVSPSAPPAQQTTPPSSGEQDVAPGSPSPLPSPEDSAPAQDSGEASPEPTSTITLEPPVCAIPDCPHLQTDEQGHMAALCPLGEWMLLHPQDMPRTTDDNPALSISPMAATIPSDITLPNEPYTIYRSGTYTLSGGGNACVLILSPDIVVSLTLTDATAIQTMKLTGSSVAEITLQGASTVAAIDRSADTKMTFTGNGSLTAGSIAEGRTGVTVTGGSVCLPGATSENGLMCYVFDAAGTTAATVNNAAYPSYTRPCADNRAYLWLPALETGQRYVAEVDNGTLKVVSEEPQPASPDTYYLSSPSFSPAPNGAYTIVRDSNPIQQILNVNQTGVTLVLNGLQAADVASVNALNPATLHLTGANSLIGLTGSVTLTGGGSLTVSSLSTSSLSLGGGVALLLDNCNPPNGWQQVPVTGGSLTADTRASMGGKRVGLCYKIGQENTVYLPLPSLPAGRSYQASLSGNVLDISTISNGDLVLNGDLNITQNGTYRITSAGAVSGNISISNNLSNVKITLAGVNTSGKLVLAKNAHVTELRLEGANQIGGGILCGNASELKVLGTGFLQTASVSKSGSGTVNFSIPTTTNLTLTSGRSILSTKLKPTVLHVTGPNNQSLPEKQIVLKVGKTLKPFTTTTDPGGYVWLWGNSALTGVDVAVLSDAETYATVVVSGSGAPDALPEITGVIADPQTNTISYSAGGALTSGVQYYVNRNGVRMPDTYVADAKRMLGQNGACALPGLKAGDVITYRVFATALPNITLKADTVDAFQFSDEGTFTAQKDSRGTFQLPAQSKTYDRTKFEFKTGLVPSGWSVTWFQDGKQLSGPPIEVGVYTAKILVPSGNANYLPGVTSVTVTIQRILVTIYPDFCFKYKGTADPKIFPYTYEGTRWGDVVTGDLTRHWGQEVGNYAYLITELSAPKYYKLEIDPFSPMFAIMYSPNHFKPFDPLARIDPVYEELIFSDGMKLKLIRSTVEKLNISGVGYGAMVTDVGDGKVRPFTPSLRLRPGYDTALLILEAEPELNADGGYATDMDGNPQLRGRRLTLTYTHLQHMRNQRITHVAFGLNGTYCLIDLSELQTEATQQLMAQGGMARRGSHFTFTLTPISDRDAVPETALSAAEHAMLREPVTEIRMEAVGSGTAVDIAPALHSARVMFDASSLFQVQAESENPDIAETVIGKKADPKALEQAQEDADLQTAADGIAGVTQPTIQLMELAEEVAQRQIKRFGYSLLHYQSEPQKLDSKLVVPYTASEAETALYTAILCTKPYLMAHVPQGGFYGLAALNHNP